MHPSDKDWPLCACGCGEAVPVRKASVPSKGLKRGEPCKYIARHSNRTRVIPIIDGKKRCPKCETVKLVEAFNKDSGRASGYCPWCRECDSIKSANWYTENRDRVLQATKDYHAAHPAVSRSAALRYIKTPKGLENARLHSSAYRARKRNQFVEHVDPIVVFERDAGICGICDLPIAGPFDVDHIIPLVKGGGHSYANAQVAHPSCNYSKKDRILERTI